MVFVSQVIGDLVDRQGRIVAKVDRLRFLNWLVGRLETSVVWNSEIHDVFASTFKAETSPGSDDTDMDDIGCFFFGVFDLGI